MSLSLPLHSPLTPLSLLLSIRFTFVGEIAALHVCYVLSYGIGHHAVKVGIATEEAR